MPLCLPYMPDLQPAQTVYGLGANALDDAAVAGIYAAKGRPRCIPFGFAFSNMLSDSARITFCACVVCRKHAKTCSQNHTFIFLLSWPTAIPPNALAYSQFPHFYLHFHIYIHHTYISPVTSFTISPSISSPLYLRPPFRPFCRLFSRRPHTPATTR
jgi:hypothetical protein